MPKYLLIGLGVMAVLFVSMHYWGKLSDQGKNRVLMLIFGQHFLEMSQVFLILHQILTLMLATFGTLAMAQRVQKQILHMNMKQECMNLV